MTKPYVYMTRQVSSEVLGLIQEVAQVGVWEEDRPVPRDILLQEAKKAVALYVMLTDRIDEELLSQAPQLRMVASMAVGYDHIDLEACKRRGIVVTNTPDVLTEATADLAFALLMATGRRMVEANRYLHEGRWESWGPYLLAGQSISGRTLGIIGMGRIGEAVAKRAAGFDMRVLYNNRKPRPEAEQAYGVAYRELDDLLQESDYVLLLTPLTPETRHLMSDREFGLMKPSAVFINVSRGATVDEAALYRALTTGQIWAAGLDVFEVEPIPTDHPLLTLPNVVAMPHIGSATYETRDAMAMLAARNLVNVLIGEEPITPL
ncbi:2-hydroxyacid dehydrogenase [Brevibacillus dissolubilis]|uniref:2-hydroxyacid dehydrogenase n=1 Tax=Brevibacillus dissolubilis TaxID=1844116 RepID=UPI0011166256|nr:D-glycerate dehydrogenase [Brevibacillus dissolubilis]